MYYNIPQLLEYFIFSHDIPNLHISNSNKSLSVFKNDNVFSLYSYNEIIAKRNLEDGTIIIYGKTAKYGNFFSMTTSTHISKLINKCNEENHYYHIIPFNN
jgi:hypothetical protein